MEYAYSTQQTMDGGYIMAGAAHSNDGDVSGNHGAFDFWVVKLDALGSIQWQKCLGGTGYEWAYSIQQTTDGGFIVAGRSDSNDGDVSYGHGNYDFWVVKLDAFGSIQWQKCLGGTGWDEARSVQQTTDGGYIVAGWTSSNDGDVSGNQTGQSSFLIGDAWVVKLDGLGNIQWQRCLGGSNADGAYFIRQAADGGYIMVGHTNSNDGDVLGYHASIGGLTAAADMWVVKLDSSGTLQWQKCLGGTDIEGADSSIQQTMDGGYIVAGWTESNDGDVSGNHGHADSWVVKLDAFGDIQWQRCLGGAEWDGAFAIQQTTDGGYIVAGATYSDDGDVSGNHGSQDVWVVKLDALGNIQWQKCMGGTEHDSAQAIQQTGDGGYIMAGGATSVLGNQGTVYAWVVKLGPGTVGLNEPELVAFSLFPNPARDLVRITMLGDARVAELSLTDARGREVLRERLSSGPHDMNVGGLPRGLYLLTLRTERGWSGSQRLLVE